MKIVSFMPVLNEADILRWTVRAMQSQGVDVYCIDGWSTDGTWEMMPELGLAGYERFPAAGDSGVQCCAEILHRIEDLAADCGADWCYYSDADEIRRGPKGERLADAIECVDRRGYSVIDHKVYQFWPTDNGWTPDHDPERYFRYYDDDKSLICQPWVQQRKCWRNVGKVYLAGGGHSVQFPGCRVFPQKFIMKHYSWRTREQSIRRLKTRMRRRCHEEHKRGWGVHYDMLKEDAFICDPHGLKEWV